MLEKLKNLFDQKSKTALLPVERQSASQKYSLTYRHDRDVP